MVTFKLTQDQAKSWFPETYENFLNELKTSKSSSSGVLDENMEWYLNWGFFVKKATTEEEIANQKENYIRKMDLVYDDRIKLEIPRIRCSLNLKAGYYYRMDRVIESKNPEFVEDMAKEIIKYMMIQEQQFINNDQVLASIQEFSELMMRNWESDESPTNLNMDDILDKINDKGMSSLSPRELKYLENMSKSK
jgi:hypothetical protein